MTSMQEVEKELGGPPPNLPRAGRGSYVEHHGWKVYLLEVTPEIAAEWLLRDRPGNRNIRQGSVDKYARDQSEGRWDLAVDCIAFNKQGQLVNGRHRLMACIKSGICIPSLVLLGKETVIDIDATSARSAGDYFRLMGISSCNRAAAVAKWVAAYEVNHLGSSLQRAWSHSELWECFGRHVGIADSLTFIGGFPNEDLKRLGRAAVLVAIHYLICLETGDRSLADAYFDQLITGENVGRRDPAKMVRNRLIDLKRDEESRRLRLDNLKWATYVAKGWNAIATGSEISHLRVGEAEKFPKLRKPEGGQE